MANATPHREKLAEAIRYYRKAAGLTQAELAERADIHHNYVGEIERGEKAISIDILVRVAKALNVRVAQLVERLG